MALTPFQLDQKISRLAEVNEIMVAWTSQGTQGMLKAVSVQDIIREDTR